MKKLFYAIAVLLAMGSSLFVLPVQSSYAYDCTHHILNLRAWYDGIVNTTTCEVDQKLFEDETTAKNTIWTVVLNITSSLLGVIGYLAICFVIWGGYQYMLARGDPGKVAKGKKTIMNSLIGLTVCMLASTIAGMIADIVQEGASNGNIFTTAMNHAFTWAGIICAIIIVIGGISYATSNGNPSAVAKAKNTILYAIIGLAISLLAIAIVNTVATSL